MWKYQPKKKEKRMLHLGKKTPSNIPYAIKKILKVNCSGKERDFTAVRNNSNILRDLSDIC